jgi:hypothetical protein
MGNDEKNGPFDSFGDPRRFLEIQRSSEKLTTLYYTLVPQVPAVVSGQIARSRRGFSPSPEVNRSCRGGNRPAGLYKQALSSNYAAK